MKARSVARGSSSTSQVNREEGGGGREELVLVVVSQLEFSRLLGLPQLFSLCHNGSPQISLDFGSVQCSGLFGGREANTNSDVAWYGGQLLQSVQVKLLFISFNLNKEREVNFEFLVWARCQNTWRKRYPESTCTV